MATKTGQNRDRRHGLALGLARGRTVRQAAREAGFSERQAHRYVKQEDFQRLVSTLRTDIVDQAVGLLVAASARAVRTLSKLLDDKSSAIRLNAAKCILEMSVRYQEHGELIDRLDELERRLEETSGNLATEG